MDRKIPEELKTIPEELKADVRTVFIAYLLGVIRDSNPPEDLTLGEYTNALQIIINKEIQKRGLKERLGEATKEEIEPTLVALIACEVLEVLPLEEATH